MSLNINYLRVTVPQAETVLDGTVDGIYLNNREEIAASSVAAAHGERLLVGQIFDDGLLDGMSD